MSVQALTCSNSSLIHDNPFTEKETEAQSNEVSQPGSGGTGFSLGLKPRALHAPLLAAYTLQGWSPAVLRGMGSGLSAAFLNTGWLLNGSFPHLTAEEMEVQTGPGTLPSPTPPAHLAVGGSAGSLNPSLLAPECMPFTLGLLEEGGPGTPARVLGAPWNPFSWPPAGSSHGPL